MNDFNVLNDFELESFSAESAAAAGEGGFGLDVSYDATVDPEDTTDAEILDQDPEEITEDASDVEKTVWEDGENPFTAAGTEPETVAKIGISNEDLLAAIEKQEKNGTYQTNENGVNYYTIKLEDLTKLAFNAVISAAAPLVMETAKGIKRAIAGSSGLGLNLKNGEIKGANFRGNGSITVGISDDAAISDDGSVTVTFDGFDDIDADDDAMFVEFDGNNLKAIDTNDSTYEDGATITVNGDYDFTLNGEKVKLTAGDAAVTEDAVFEFSADGEITLDLSAIVLDGDGTLKVNKAGGADNIIPPTDSETIQIGKETFTYNAPSGESYFTLDDSGAVTGFALVNTDDSITVGKGTAIAIYDEDGNALEDFAVDTKGGYTITKTDDGYMLSITQTAEVTVGDVGLNFTISKATKEAMADAATTINIYFDEEFAITGVENLDALTSAKDSMAVTGLVATGEDSGLPIGQDAANGYLSVNGAFTYVGGAAAADRQLEVADGAIIYSVHEGLQVVIDGDAGTVTDDVATEDYGYTGTGGYFTTTVDGIITGFVFGETGTVTVPIDNEDFAVTVDGNVLALPEVTDETDDSYTLARTKDGFEISDLGAGATVEGITFAANDGTVYFDAALNVTGVASTGDVTFDGDAAALLEAGTFEINGTALPVIDTNGEEITYNAEGNYLKTDENVWLLGTEVGNEYEGYTVAGDTDDVTVFTLDEKENIVAVDDLDKGTVTGDFTTEGFTVNDQEIKTTDTELTITGNEDATDIVAIAGLDEGNVTLAADTESGISVNGAAVDFTADEIVVEGDGTQVTKVTGLDAGDEISIKDNTVAEYVFESDSTDGVGDVYTVNDVAYTVTNDKDGVTITGAGEVLGLDAGAELTVDPATAVTVNGKEYTANQVDGETIIGFETKGGNDSSYVTDAAHPLLNANSDDDDLSLALGLDVDGFDADKVVNESDEDYTGDYSAESGKWRANLDGTDVDSTTSLKFNNDGKNLAVVEDGARGVKNIVLGSRGDAVIIEPNADDKDSLVSITGGVGNDSIIVQGEMPVVFNMGGEAGGNDKIITYAAANGNVTLENYDPINTKSGIVVHDPEMQDVKDIADAIEDNLLLFEDGQIVAIEKDETSTGTDQRTAIKIAGTSNPMVRLYGYKDNQDQISDDTGRLVGFTSRDGGTLDATAIEENVVLVGNKAGVKEKEGSSLASGIGNDTLFGGSNDTLNAGKGENLVIISGDQDRDAATVVLGEGRTTIKGLQSGFDGDVLNADLASSDTQVSLEDGTLIVSSKSDKFTATAQDVVDEDAEFVNQLFINGEETIKAAIAAEGGTITVGSDVPNYFMGNGSDIDFSAYDGSVQIDLGGDWAENKIGDNDVTVINGIDALTGGTGTTFFKGGSAAETLTAGLGETTLYGDGGKNLLVGQADNDDKTGSTEFFVNGLANGAQNTIRNFEFIEADGGNQATFDALALEMTNTDVTDVKVSGDDVVIAVKGKETNATEKVTIEGAAGEEFMVDRGRETETVAQIAATENTINNSYVDFYYATEKNATVKVGENISSAKIWLESPEMNDGVEFVGDYTVIDARGSSAAVEMAGNNVANTIYGGDGNASMWGGSGNANDVMYGGSAHNEFYYEVGNGNDTIMSANTGDIIHLGATIDQIDFDNTNITNTGVEVKFSDGGTLSINSTNEVSFSLDDGSTYKVNRQTKRFEN